MEDIDDKDRLNILRRIALGDREALEDLAALYERHDCNPRVVADIRLALTDDEAWRDILSVVHQVIRAVSID